MYPFVTFLTNCFKLQLAHLLIKLQTQKNIIEGRRFLIHQKIVKEKVGIAY